MRGQNASQIETHFSTGFAATPTAISLRFMERKQMEMKFYSEMLVAVCDIERIGCALKVCPKCMKLRLVPPV